MIDYSAFVVRRDVAIAKAEATLKDWRDREGHIVNPDARRGFAKTIKSLESRINALRLERLAFVSLVDEFKRIDAERNPPLPMGLEGPSRKAR
ncbi:MAG: hypothetical protein [Microvirus sp.]|nr:MAG: hypothetical protein [Microvirus sp.]